MSTSRPPLNRLPGSIRKYITGENFQRFLPVLFVIGGSAIPASVILIVAILKQGHVTTFAPDDPHVSWVKGPETRGTFNIIWVCATTIFTCVYVSVHVDVPDHEDTEGEDVDGFELEPHARKGSCLRRWIMALNRWVLNARSWLWHKIKPNLRKAYWVFFNIFAPELMVLVAFCERESAKSGVEFMFNACDQKKWKLRHAFFADMGGFKLPKRSGGTEFRTGRSFYEWFRRERCPSLDYKEIERDIKDRSKKDIILKIFTCVQAAWFIIETLERFAQHQPVSALEVTTCSYIVCAIITQVCWLRKPYGVNRSHSVHIESEGTKHNSAGSRPTTKSLSTTSKFELQQVPELGPGKEDEEKLRRSIPASSSPSQGESKEQRSNSEDGLPRLLFENAPSTPFNRAYMNPRKSMLLSCLCACSVGVIVGFIHIIPFWNTRFVNTEGQWMWRACCGVQISVFLAFAFSAAIEPLYHGVLLWVSLLFLCLFYCMSRIVLFALIWTSFSSQPAGLYQNVHWGFGLFPHLD